MFNKFKKFWTALLGASFGTSQTCNTSFPVSQVELASGIITHVSFEDFAGLIQWTEDQPGGAEKFLEEFCDYLRENGIPDGEFIETPIINGSHLRIVLVKCWQDCSEAEKSVVTRFHDRDQF